MSELFTSAENQDYWKVFFFLLLINQNKIELLNMPSSESPLNNIFKPTGESFIWNYKGKQIRLLHFDLWK